MLMLPASSRPLRALSGTGSLRVRFLTLGALVLLIPAGSRAGKINPSPHVTEALRKIYNGDTAGAIEIAKRVEHDRPQHPIGYVLEANALWWKIYCASCEVKWNLIDAWDRPEVREDDAYITLADRAIQLAEAEIATRETAEMRVYAGMGHGLEARLYGLRGEHRNVARHGVKARAHYARALELDPEMGDAYTGMGLYNYFADVLSPMAKVLRFFLGIPGGSKKEGIRQLEIAMKTAELSAEEARFYLARNLRNFDQQYERAGELLEPLVAEYPRNAVFLLLLGDVSSKLHRDGKAEASFRAAQKIEIGDAACAARVAALASKALASAEK